MHQARHFMHCELFEALTDFDLSVAVTAAAGWAAKGMHARPSSSVVLPCGAALHGWVVYARIP
jgi:hypothetical protein